MNATNSAALQHEAVEARAQEIIDAIPRWVAAAKARGDRRITLMGLFEGVNYQTPNIVHGLLEEFRLISPSVNRLTGDAAIVGNWCVKLDGVRLAVGKKGCRGGRPLYLFIA